MMKDSNKIIKIVLLWVISFNIIVVITVIVSAYQLVSMLK